MSDEGMNDIILEESNNLVLVAISIVTRFEIMELCKFRVSVKSKYNAIVPEKIM